MKHSKRMADTAGPGRLTAVVLMICQVPVWGFAEETLTDKPPVGIAANAGDTNLPVEGSAAGPAVKAGATNEVKADVSAPVESPKHTNDLATFQMIADRNIFNPNRTRRSRSGASETEKPRVPVSDVIALSGTIIYAKGNYAFFDSSASKFRKAAKIGDQIAGYTLKEVQQTHVALQRGQESLNLKIGEQLRREDEGAWQVTSDVTFTSSDNGSQTTTASDPAAEPSSDKSNSTSPTPSGASEGPSEALKRLLEKRKKEQTQ